MPAIWRAFILAIQSADHAAQWTTSFFTHECADNAALWLSHCAAFMLAKCSSDHSTLRTAVRCTDFERADWYAFFNAFSCPNEPTLDPANAATDQRTFQSAFYAALFESIFEPNRFSNIDAFYSAQWVADKLAIESAGELSHIDSVYVSNNAAVWSAILAAILYANFITNIHTNK